MTLEAPIARSDASTNTTGRWGQLVCGLVCMVMIANLQYGNVILGYGYEAAFLWFGLGQGLMILVGAYERDDLLHQRIVGKLARDPVNSVGEDTIAKEKPLVRLA